MSERSPFAALGLPDTASAEDVRQAWRTLASQHHPDKGGNQVAFMECREAFQAALRLAQAPKPCPYCREGRVEVQRGFGRLTIACDHCGGSGVL